MVKACEYGTCADPGAVTVEYPATSGYPALWCCPACAEVAREEAAHLAGRCDWCDSRSDVRDAWATPSHEGDDHDVVRLCRRCRDRAGFLTVEA